MNKSKELVNMNEFEQQQNAEIFEVTNKSNLKLFDQQNENELIKKNRNKQKIELYDMDKANLYQKQDIINNERQYYYHTRSSKKISILQNNNKRKKKIKDKKDNNNNKSINKEEQEEQEEEEKKEKKEKGKEKNISKKEKIEIKKKEKNQQLLNCKNKNKKIPKFVLKAKQQLQQLLKQQKQKQRLKQRQKRNKKEINLQQQQQQKLYNIESQDSDKVQFIESKKVIKKNNKIKVNEIDNKKEEKINIDLKKKRRNKIKKNNKNRQKNEQNEQKQKQNTKNKQKQQKLLKRKQQKLRKPIIKNLIVTKNTELIPVDQYFTKLNQVKVLFINSAYYSATLTQSNIVKNDNKFYIVQILEQEQNQDKCWLFSRWGRIGVTGQKTENGPISRKQAIRHYHNKIQDKIKIGHYKVLENHYGSEQRCETEQIQLQIHEKRSQLNIKVQELLHLIFDKKMMNNHMKQIGYNDKKLPLGLLGKYNIKKGYESLNDLLQQLKDSNKKLWQKKDKLNQLSSQFYSAIPHDFGYINMQAYILDTQNKIKQKLQMLQSLQDIQIYTKFIHQKQQQNNNNNNINQLDLKYLKLHTKIEPLDKRNEIYQMLMKYIENTHALTHDKYSLEVQDIFTIDRQEQKNTYKQYLDNKQLLWHGSRLTNYVGILCQGLKIAPLYAPITGYMFGKGIYFADMVSKSANYCLANRIYNQGLLLLCQVALGDMNLKYCTDFNASNLPLGKQSTKGVGKTAPQGGQLLDDIWVPNGKIAPNGITETNLLYNQYVVYDVTQIRCRFIVKVKFDFK